MSREEWEARVERYKFWIKVTHFEYYDTWQVGRMKMNFVIHSQAQKRKCAYQFSAWTRNYKSDFELSQEKLKVIDFIKKDGDPWDRFTANSAWNADGFVSQSCQLYSQTAVDVKKTSNLHSMRMIMYVENVNKEEIPFWLRYPEPMSPFVIDGEVRRLGNIY